MFDEMKMDRFLNALMKNDYKRVDGDNIRKFYNQSFEVLVYNLGKKTKAIVIDKRLQGKTVVYNNVDIASFHLLE